MITKRNFLKNLLVGTAAFAILPGAGRRWIKPKDASLFVINPEWSEAQYELVMSIQAWNYFTDRRIFPPNMGDVKRYVVDPPTFSWKEALLT